MRMSTSDVNLKRSILIVDDEESIHLAVGKYLEIGGYQVFAALTGEEGLDLFRRHHPDIVLLDLRLPGMSGNTLLSILHREAPETPVIIISGWGRAQDVIQAIRFGAWDYISKPFTDLGIFDVVIDKAIERSQIIRENRQYRENLEKLVRQKQRELSDQKEMFALFMDHFPGFVFMKDNKSKYTYTNKYMQDILGDDRLTGKGPEDIYPPGIVEMIRREDQEVLQTGYVNVTDNVRDKSGAEHILQTHKFAIPRTGKSPLVGCIALNVTEQMRLEEERILLSKAFECAAETIVITNSDGRVMYANPAAETSTGYTRRELMNNTMRIVRSGRQDTPFYTRLWQTITTGRVWNGHFINRRKDGTLYEEEATISPILNSKGEITHFIAVKKDVTTEVQLQNQLRQAQKMEAIGTLAGGIAHDFNNILSIIIGFSELASLNIPDDSAAQPLVNEVIRASTRAKELVQQILTFSRQKETERSYISTAVIAREVIRMLRASLPATIHIRHDIASEGVILADPTQIHQIIMNLATNAFHAMKDEGGTLTVTLTDIPGSHLQEDLRLKLPGDIYQKLTVSDTGCGIPQHIRERIFEPYFTTKGQGEGTGLGLSIVHGIIESYNGAIELTSEEGKGTTFAIYIPLVKIETTPPGEETTQKLETTPATILFVDDEVSIVDMNKRFLEHFGYNVSCFLNPEEALDCLRSDPTVFDIVITDMTMPEMTGLKLAQEIRKFRPDIPIIVCTGFSEKIDRDVIVREGLQALLFKPVIAREMVQTIEDLLNPTPADKGETDPQ